MDGLQLLSYKVVEEGLFELGGTVVIPDVGRCGSRPIQRTEAAGKFLRVDLSFIYVHS